MIQANRLLPTRESLEDELAMFEDGVAAYECGEYQPSHVG